MTLPSLVIHEIIDTTLTPEEAWQVMADTQHINELLYRLPASSVVKHQDGSTAMRIRLAGVWLEYDEEPFWFEAPKGYRNMRRFRTGPVSSLQTNCSLHQTVTGTKIDYRLEYTPRNWRGRLVLAAVRMETRTGVKRLRAMIASMEKSAGHVPQWPPANPRAAETLARLDERAERWLPALNNDERLAYDRLRDWMAHAPAADVSRLRPYALADSWGLPRAAVLACCLHATKAGVLGLSWDLLCPACDGAKEFKRLSDVPTARHCEWCDIDVSANVASNVEASFAPHSSVRAADRAVFCLGSPRGTPRWLAQFPVAANSSYALQVKLGVGRYRLQTAGSTRGNDIDVSAQGAEAHDAVLDDTHGLVASAPGPLSAGQVVLTIQNPNTTPVRCQLVHRTHASQAATALDVSRLGLFRDLFGAEAVQLDDSLHVATCTILFTDLVGSTAMYEREGDARAYGLVKAHFRLLFAAVEHNGGRVVKTIGDSVMASFDAPDAAIAAGVAMIRAVQQLRTPDDRDAQLGLRVGVHIGPCLVVNANEQVDYFGRTVNVAARVESLANKDEVLVSEQALAEPSTASAISLLTDCTFTPDAQPVKGVAQPVQVLRIAVAPAT
jgi:class 3 adenylate cyclase